MVEAAENQRMLEKGKETEGSSKERPVDFKLVTPSFNFTFD
jgi:hypothetical protein